MTDGQTFVVVGAGQAGGWTAKTLRDEGFTGRIVLLGEEAFVPYERPPLSKDALLGNAAVEKCYLWPPESWAELNVEFRPRTRAARIDRQRHEVVLDGGETIRYDRLMLASGARPRLLPVSGADLDGIHYLRAIPDTLAIRAHLPQGGRALVVGGGWIGLEVAAALTRLGVAVVLAEVAPRLCARAATPALSAWLLDLHRAKGVDIRLGCGATRFEGDGRLARAVLSDGSVVETTLAVIGIGVVPNVELAADSDLAVENGVRVDELCRTSDPDIFAAGDVTCHPNPFAGRNVRLESWENAQNQAIAGARAMLDKDTAYAEVPWFWSDQYDSNIQMIGVPESWDDEATRGDPASGSFITFHLQGGCICAAVAVNNGRDLRFARRLMQMRKPVSVDDLANAEVKLQNLLKG
jgi:3-phenylpropionate/trans-cinnamate dioxygenase ferredoxin reductase subunit